MTRLLTDFPQHFLIFPGIQSYAQLLHVVAQGCILFLVFCCWCCCCCCCCWCQSLVVVVRSQYWTRGAGAAGASHLKLDFASNQTLILRKNPEKDNYRETCKRNVIHFYLLVGFLRCLQDGFCSGVSVGELKLIRVQRFMALLAILSWDLKTTPLSQNNLDKIDIHQPSKACLSSWHWWRWWWRWWRGGWWPGCYWTANIHWYWQS